MKLNISKEVGVMKRMTTRQLKDRYEEVFDEACRSNHKQWLIKRIAWRLQANEEGDLSERARRRAMELANDADLRMKAPPKNKVVSASAARKVTGTIPREHDDRIPMPGTIITRECKGHTLQVTVLPDGFEYDGDMYQSLSAVAKVDCVVVYKVDRLSRSLLDFARLMETFERYQVSFVSVTQQFSTTSSMGRLTLNILLSFAQFERDIISERTRDKMAAARRKGKYVGGAPILGYDIDRERSCLVVNEQEATRVRQIFEQYLEQQSLIPTIAELDRRGWATKRWTTKKGKLRGGRPFNKNNLYGLLTNATYIGKICYKDEVYEGQHQAIVDPEIFERVRRLLRLNHRTGGARVRNKFGALLKGLLHCVPCNCGMTHSHTTKNKTKRYRYYVCVNAQKRGWHNCPTRSIPAPEIERFVVDQIKTLARNPSIAAETIVQVREHVEDSLRTLEAERRGIQRDVAQADKEIRMLAVETTGVEEDSLAMGRLADLQDRVQNGERRLTEIREEEIRLRTGLVDERDIAQALREFDPLWESLSLREQARVLHLLIERVDYNGEDSTVSVTFRPSGITELATLEEEPA